MNKNLDFIGLTRLHLKQSLSILIELICKLKPGQLGSELISFTEFLNQLMISVESLEQVMQPYKEHLKYLKSWFKTLNLTFITLFCLGGTFIPRLESGLLADLSLLKVVRAPGELYISMFVELREQVAESLIRSMGSFRIAIFIDQRIHLLNGNLEFLKTVGRIIRAAKGRLQHVLLTHSKYSSILN